LDATATLDLFQEGNMGYPILESATVFQGKAFDVRQDTVELPDGRPTRLDIVDHRAAVTLIPLDETGRVLFVRQYRHAAAEMLLELPAGVMEEGETPEACARREIREETGFAAGDLRKLGEFFLAPGYSTELMHVYLATGLRPGPLQADADEFLDVEAIPTEQAISLAQTGGIRDAKTLGALFLAVRFLPPPAPAC
jgi:ADP-ribose pyrophosphatase